MLGYDLLQRFLQAERTLNDELRKFEIQANHERMVTGFQNLGE